LVENGYDHALFSTLLMAAYPPMYHGIFIHTFLRPAYPQGGGRKKLLCWVFCPNGLNKLRLCIVGVCSFQKEPGAFDSIRS